MGPDNIFVKILVTLILVGVVAHFVIKYRDEQARQVKVTQNAIQTVADQVAGGATADVDAVTAAISPLHDCSYSNIIEGIRQSGASAEEYIGCEIILLRMYELIPTANIKTRIKIEGSGPYWPWTFEGDQAKLDPFKMDSGSEVGSINDLITMYEQQGTLRKPWRG